MSEKRHVVIPIRGITKSMTRLRNKLNNDEMVNVIVSKLFFNTLRIVQEFNFIPIILTSEEEFQIDLMEKYGIEKVYLDDGESINEALNSISSSLPDENIFFLMPDLPGLTETVILKLLKLEELYQYIVCPTIDGGTAAGIFPKSLFNNSLFGESSSNKISEYLDTQGLDVAILEIMDINRDLDTIDDWNHWKNHFKEHF